MADHITKIGSGAEKTYVHLLNPQVGMNGYEDDDVFMCMGGNCYGHVNCYINCHYVCFCFTCFG